MPQPSRRSLSLQMKLTAIFATLAGICAVLFIGIIYFFFRSQINQNLSQHLADVTAITSSQIDGDAIAALIASGDSNSDVYTKLRQQLVNASHASSDISRLAVVAVESGNFTYVVDSSDQPAAMGDPFTKAGPALITNAGAITEPLVEDDTVSTTGGDWRLAYAPITNANGDVVALLVVEQDANAGLANQKQLLLVALIVLATAIPATIVVGYLLSLLVARPIVRIARVAHQIAEVDLVHLTAAARSIAEGDLTQSLHIQASPIDYHSRDELGELANACNDMIGNLQGAGKAFDEMSHNLRDLVGRVVENANQVSQAAAQVSAVTGQTGEAVAQIAATIQQVARGTANQTQAVTQTAASMGQMARAIDGVAHGAQEQAQATNKAAEVAHQINASIRQVAESAQATSEATRQVTQCAEDGSRTVQVTLQGMQNIKNQVNLSAQKVQEMGQRSEQIDDIVQEIDEIASQTNLLSVNAAIETARAQSQATLLTENLLNRQMVTQAELLNQLMLENHQASRSLAYWIQLAKDSHLDSICIIDRDGLVVESNESDLVGWRLPEDPKAQAYAFRKLIYKEGAVCQAPQRRSKDNQVFKYVGVHRRDEPGVVQVGFIADTVDKFAIQMGGFAVVASEVNKLAEQTRSAAKEINELNHKIQAAVKEAIQTIQGSVGEVDAEARNANQAGQALEQILTAVEGMARQAGQSAGAAQEMGRLSDALVGAVEAVSAVVEENTAATEEMAANSSEVSQSVETIASISEENSASAEEVSASAEEMSGQVSEVTASAQSLARMAEDLLALVQRFRLEEETRKAPQPGGRNGSSPKAVQPANTYPN